ncbi:MAG: hypothetical protein HKN35_14745 [Woeseia sp.]|nr:hypothetical protein [Woeseia sp.]NNE62150.1 hypothetical protein [Woeseia sp.]
MNIRKMMTFAAAASAFALSACEIEQTEEGDMPDIDVAATEGQLPKYDVDVTKTQEGRMPDVDVDVEGGNLPKYDVHGPDVDVSMEEKTIEVPDVDVDVSTEEKTISVPDVDVDFPDDNDDM